LAALSAAFVLVSPTPAFAAGAPCGRTPGLLCSTVTVPLDRTGAVPGTIGLHVEELPATGTPRGTVFLLAGGPGQGSAHTFDLGTVANALVFRFLFPGYTLVAYDDRGTGGSGLLNCPALQTATTVTGEDALASACATSIGAGSPFYGTVDHAADLDAVRSSLGFDKISLYGVSYGTKLALAYASEYPSHVAGLVLDSVLPTDLPDPYSANVARSMPATLDAWCADACKAATPNFAEDVIAVANKLAVKPAKGLVIQPNGRTKSDTLDGASLLSVVVDADLNPGLAAELPAAVHAARLGVMAPLLRLHALDTQTNELSATDLSAGLFAATVCRDGPFPWAADSSPASRPALLKQAIAALPAGTFGPFGNYAAQLGNAVLCDEWPTPSGGAAISPNPLPNVPVLALSGGFDMRTPTAGAQSVIAQFPQGQLVVVPGVGHSVVTADPSECAAVAVHDWVMNGSAASTCPRSGFLVPPLGAFPTTLKTKAGPATTYAIVQKTIREADAAWLLINAQSPVAGVAGGTMTPISIGGYRLDNYSVVPGVALSGQIVLGQSMGVTLSFHGTITVAGKLAAHGDVQLLQNTLTGTLGNRTFG
ncbi:MAG: alpha/beta fold hydrolase, partial [Actinobacteria bacterium]|nr:alpha/beta fold hydrolase [Actinomycetota bacterium]